MVKRPLTRSKMYLFSATVPTKNGRMNLVGKARPKSILRPVKTTEAGNDDVCIRQFKPKLVLSDHIGPIRDPKRSLGAFHELINPILRSFSSFIGFTSKKN